MNVSSIVEIAVIIICVVTYAFMIYFKVKGNLAEGVSELIALAEKTNLAGSEKMAQVVEKMYESVPAPLKKVFNKKQLEKIAQWVFNWMRRYADAYKNALETQGNATDAQNTANTEALTELVSQLLDITKEEALRIAIENGIKLEGLTTKEEYIKAIVLHVMKKD